MYVCCLLPRVTARHMKPCAQSVKKDSMAAHVMSSTVAAALNILVTVNKDDCTVSLNDKYAYQKCYYVVQLFV
jgi:hypothetical protein